MNQELPDVQGGLRKGRGTRYPIASIRWNIKKAREFQEKKKKTSISSVLTKPKPLTVWITSNCGKFLKETRIPDLLTCLLRNLYAGQEAKVRIDTEQWAGSTLGKEYIKTVYCQLAYFTYMQSTLCEMSGC